MSPDGQPPEVGPSPGAPKPAENQQRWLPREGAAPRPAPRPAPSEVDERAPAVGGRRPFAKAPIGRRLSVPLWGVLLAGVLLAGALLAFVLAIGGGEEPAAQPAAPPAPRAAARPAPASAARRLAGFTSRATRKPFTVEGVRWAVFVDPQQSWTGFTRVVPAGAGQRWLLVAVRARNLARTRFDPRVLPYQVLDAGGRAYFPDRRFGTGRRLNGTPQPLAVKRVAQTELAFRVPAGAAALTLLFDAGRGTRAPTQVVLDAG